MFFSETSENSRKHQTIQERAASYSSTVLAEENCRTDEDTEKGLFTCNQGKMLKQGLINKTKECYIRKKCHHPITLSVMYKNTSILDEDGKGTDFTVKQL